MIGQWIGWVKGTNEAFITLNLEKASGNKYYGRLMFADFNITLPSLSAEVVIEEKNKKIEGALFNFSKFNAISLQLESAELVGGPTSGNIKGVLNDEDIAGEWISNIGTKGSFFLLKSQADRPSLANHSFSWDEFKTWVTETRENGKEAIFRGQQNASDRLRTSFHRTGRTDLVNYGLSNVPELAYFINSISDYKYDVNKVEEYGALLSLAQHHGYATPLLDWTESPYIAAYFAYEHIRKDETNGNVRVFVFYYKNWNNIYIQPLVVSIFTPQPMFTVHRFSVFNNRRAVPQQSVSTFSNIDDIEGFINMYERYNKDIYLTKIDLPIADRNKVINDLKCMGITAGSLFPGFDGTCRFLKEKHF